MEDKELLDLLYTTLKDRGLWFITKNDYDFGSTIIYDLDKYDKLSNSKQIKKIVKSINDFIGDGASNIYEAISLWIERAQYEDFSVNYIDNLQMKFEDEPILDNIEASAININKYKKPFAKFLGENKKYESEERDTDLIEDYKGRVKQSIQDNTIEKFNYLKDILSNGENKVEYDGFYFPEEAVYIVTNGDMNQNLNSYMNLTVSNILNDINDFDSIEEVIDNYFEEYRPDSAFTWATNFVDVLNSLDINSYNDYMSTEYNEDEDYFTESIDNVSFEEIITRMSNATDYEELYNACDLIKDRQLQLVVRQEIEQCEIDGDNVEEAYSIVTSDILDSYINEENTADLLECNKLTEEINYISKTDKYGLIGDHEGYKIVDLKDNSVKQDLGRVTKQDALASLDELDENKGIKTENKKLTEGAGAGYTILGIIDNPKVFTYEVLSEKEINKYKEREIDISCDIDVELYNLDFSSYYYGGKIDFPVEAKILGLIMRDGDYDEELPEINAQNIKESLEGITFKALLGAGWSHVKFTGVFDAETEGNVYAPFCIDNVTIEIPNKTITEFIDNKVAGNLDTATYEVQDQNRDLVDTFEDEEEAINYAKENNASIVVKVYHNYSLIDAEGSEDDDTDYDIIWSAEDNEDLEESKKTESKDYNFSDLRMAAESLWGDDPVVRDTRVEGIYDCYTAGHGGYLVDTNIFPELAKYGAETTVDNIVGFEEDYEALKVIWAVPEVLEKIQLEKDWYKNLTLDDVLRYEDRLNDDFRKEFPNKKEIAESKQIESLEKKSNIQGLEDYFEEEIKQIVKDYIYQTLLESDIITDEEDLLIKDIQVYGSRGRGTAKDNSDLDIVFEYEGDFREDDLFNALNYRGEELYINNIKVDINPICAERSGDMNSFITRAKEYDKDILNKKKTESKYDDNYRGNEYWEINDLYNEEGTITEEDVLDRLKELYYSRQAIKKAYEEITGQKLDEKQQCEAKIKSLSKEKKIESEDEVEDWGPYYVKTFNASGTDIDTIGFEDEQEACRYAEDNSKKKPDFEYAVYDTATDECLYVYGKEEESKKIKIEDKSSNDTIRDYAIKYLNGYIDNDVSDTEVDMLVCFSFDFNDTLKDNYDEFMNILGRRTKIIKENGEILICDFSSVFKPYNEQLKEFFDMENSEFSENEAYYEAVLNLEALISGNATESEYRQLVNILKNGKRLEENKKVEETIDIDKINKDIEQMSLNLVSKWKDYEDFVCDWCGTTFKGKISDKGIMPNCPHCEKDRYKDCDNTQDGFANKDVHFYNPETEETIYTDYEGNIADNTELNNDLPFGESKKITEGRILKFQQITDDRFDKNTKELLQKRLEELSDKLNIEGIEFTYTEPYEVDFGDSKQWRSNCVVKKTSKDMTWNDIYKIVNSVKAVPYKLVTETVEDEISKEEIEDTEIKEKEIEEEPDKVKDNEEEMTDRTKELYNDLVDAGMKTEVTVENGENDISVIVNEENGKVIISVRDDNKIIGVTDGSITLNNDSLQMLNNIKDIIEEEE